VAVKLGVHGADLTEPIRGQFSRPLDSPRLAIQVLRAPFSLETTHPNLSLAELSDDLLRSELLPSWHLLPSLGLRYQRFSLEVATFKGGRSKSEAWFTVPNRRILRTGTRHLIVAVTDFGTPALARYQRVIVTVTP
jgi:hypothetical protein